MTNFLSAHGLFRLQRMPFWLIDAIYTFQQSKDVVMKTSKWQFAMVKLDDITAFFKTSEEDIADTDQAFFFFRNTIANLKLKMVWFFMKLIENFEHVSYVDQH